MICEGDVFVDQFTEQKLRGSRIPDIVNKTEMIIDPDSDKPGVKGRWNVKNDGHNG